MRVIGRDGLAYVDVFIVLASVGYRVIQELYTVI